MYDWTTDYLINYIKDNSKNNFVLIEFSYKQLGRSEKWFEEQCQALSYDMFKINREILLEWNSASDKCPFTEEEIQRIKQNLKEVVYKLFLRNNQPLSIYKDVDFTKTYIISCDCATGMSLDSSAIIVTDPDNYMEVIAEFNSNTIDTIEFAEAIYEVAKKYFMQGPIIIERNSVGKSVIDFLRKTDIADRLYYEYKEVTAEKKVADARKKTKSKQMVRYYGINTDNSTRPKMLDSLRQVVNENYMYINSPRIVNEIAGLERKSNGKSICLICI